MKNLINRITALCLLLTVVCFASITTVTATGDSSQTGSIEVTICTNAEGIKVTLYDVADYVNGKYEINPAFAQADVNLDDLSNSNSAKSAALALQDYALQNSVEGVATRIDCDGMVKFSDLASEKLYLIIQSSDHYNISMQPLLIVLPYYTDGNVIYDVSVTAKFIDSASYEFKSAVILNKVGYNNTTLQGAEFDLQRKIYYTDDSKLPSDVSKGSDENGTYYWKPFAVDLVTDSNGQICVDKLFFGTYRFIETKAPDGYILDSTPHEFNVDSYGIVKTENGLYVKDKGDPIELTISNEPSPSYEPSEPSEPSESSEPVNPSTPSSEPPDTSTTLTGDDIAKYIIIGAAVLISLAVIIVLLVTRKKKD